MHGFFRFFQTWAASSSPFLKSRLENTAAEKMANTPAQALAMSMGRTTAVSTEEVKPKWQASIQPAEAEKAA